MSGSCGRTPAAIPNMKPFLALAFTAALGAALLRAAPADDVTAAARKLAQAANYSWTSTTEIANSQFPAMPVEGATERDGFTVITRKFNENTMQTIRKGELMVTQNREGEWMTMEEMRAQFSGGQGGGRQGGGGQGRGGRGGFFGGGMFGAGTGNPAEMAGRLATRLKDLKVEGEVITGSATGDEAAALLAPDGGRGGQGPAGPKYTSAAVKFWLKDGALVKLSLRTQGSFAMQDGQEREFESTTTVEIAKVGSTKVEVPEAAKKKLGL